jgi:hypothetical protein
MLKEEVAQMVKTFHTGLFVGKKELHAQTQSERN